MRRGLLPEQRRCLPSIVIPRLKKIDACLTDLINEPVFLCDASGPAPGQHILQRFRLADSLSRSIDIAWPCPRPARCRAVRSRRGRAILQRRLWLSIATRASLPRGTLVCDHNKW
jgi:hypothetical protein